MAVLFLLLAIIVGVAVGDAAVANTSAGSVQLFDRTFTGFTQGQLLLMAAGAGFIFTSLLLLAWGSSRNRRIRRRERCTIQRDMESRIGELERENADLRDKVHRESRASRLGDTVGADNTGEMAPQSRTPLPRRLPRRPDRLDQSTPPTTAESATRHDMFDPADG
jgi:hypothetical protein